jgi:hypothetical protein
VGNIKSDTFISQFKAPSLPIIESTTSPTTIPTTTNEATTSTNIPTTLTNEPKKRGRPKDTDEVKASKKVL